MLQSYISQLKLEGFVLMSDMVYITQVLKTFIINLSFEFLHNKFIEDNKSTIIVTVYFKTFPYLHDPDIFCTFDRSGKIESIRIKKFF